MYPVSQEFIQAMKSPTQEYTITGAIGSVPFADANILAGSFSITNQCSDGTELTIGSVYIGELDATFIGLNLDRYAWYGKEIAINFCPVGFDPIPLGIFTVSEADWTSSGVVVKAYDHMAKFDKPYNQSQYSGTPYQILSFACDACGVTLGMTQAEVEAFANGTRTIALYEENDVETWRDMISWLAVTLGAFATIDRAGNLIFKTYTDEPVDVIDSTIRYSGASFSDYETRYTGLSYADVEDQATHYFNVLPDDGLTYNIGVNPFMQYGLRVTRDAMAVEVLEALQAVRYVPFSVTSTSNPAYDLGDVIRFTGGLADDTKISCVTKFTFDYNKGYSMTGVGKNPSLVSAKSKVDKDISGLLSKVNANQQTVYSYVNVDAVTFGEDEEALMLEFSFATISDNANIDLWMEANLDVTVLDELARCTVKYYLNDVLIAYSPVEVWDVSDKHILALHYYLGDLEENTRYTWRATITMSDGSATAAIDTIHALLRGYGLAGKGGRWDGTIEASDYLPLTNIHILTAPISDAVNSVETHIPQGITLSQNVTLVNIDIDYLPITESKQIETPMMIFSPWTNANLISTTGTTVTAQIGWTGSGSVGSGTSATLITDEIVGVTGVTVHGTGSLYSRETLFIVSPDSGSTWYGVSNGQWTADYRMNVYEINGISSALWAEMDSSIIKIYLGAGETIYEINCHGANNDVASLNYYLLDADEGIAVYDTGYVLLTDYWQMITEYEPVVESESIDSGYLKSVNIDTDAFATISNISLQSLLFYEYATFTGGHAFQLSRSVNADDMLSVDFQFAGYINDQHVVGNSSNANYSHLTEYSQRWFCSQGTAETSFDATNYPLGDRHLWESNKNGGNYMDGTKVTNYTPTTNNSAYYQIGGRNGVYNFRGRIYRYTITSISTGNKLYDLRPAKYKDEHEGLYDVVNDVWYETGIEVGGNVMS